MRKAVFLMFMAALAGLFICMQRTHARALPVREQPVATHKFAYGPGADQFGELWLPSGNGPHPVVILIHGGCWQEALPGVEQMASLAEALRKDGIAVWDIEYRRIGAEGGGYPGTFLDVADGADYLRKIQRRYALDLSHVVTLGHSAGGHLALWTAGRSRLKKSGPLYRKNPLPVHAAVSMAGINDLAAYREDGPSCGGAKTIDGISGGQDLYAETSPAAMLPLHVPQVIVSGGDDDIVPPGFGDAYGAAAKAAGDKVEVMDIDGTGHMDFIDPQSDAWKKVKASLLPYLK